MFPSTKIRVLIADDNHQSVRQLADYLKEHRFEVKTVHSGKECLKVVDEWSPLFVLVDLMLPDTNAYEILDHIRDDPKKYSFTKVIIISSHNVEANIRMSIKRGVADYLVKPFCYEDLLRRLVFHSQKNRLVKDISDDKMKTTNEGTLFLHLTDLVLRAAISHNSVADKLSLLTRMVALKLDSLRCSIINVKDHKTGIVVISHENHNASGFQLDLNKYPEIIHVYNTGLVVAIENLETSAKLKPIKAHLKNIMFNSLIVCPISKENEVFGVLSLCLPAKKQSFTDNEIRFVEIVSHTISLVLSSQEAVEIGHFWEKSA